MVSAVDTLTSEMEQPSKETSQYPNTSIVDHTNDDSLNKLSHPNTANSQNMDQDTINNQLSDILQTQNEFNLNENGMD